MAVSEKLEQLVAQMPDPDRRGMYTEDIDKAKIEKAAAGIAEEGAAYVAGLIEMLDAPGTVEDAKPHYALHCVINHTLVAGDEPRRESFCKTMASQVTNEKLSKYNRAYLCQELQWAGRDEACPALGKVLLDEEICDAAATALAAIGGERAASQLRAAAKRADGKCRLNVIDALAALDDPQAAGIFKEALGDDDREVRIAAAAGWSQLGRADAAEPLLKAADAAEGWERTQLTKSCLVLAEKLAGAGRTAEAKRIYEELGGSRTGDAEEHVREAARRGLAAIA